MTIFLVLHQVSQDLNGAVLSGSYGETHKDSSNQWGRNCYVIAIARVTSSSSIEHSVTWSQGPDLNFIV